MMRIIIWLLAAFGSYVLFQQFKVATNVQGSVSVPIVAPTGNGR